MRKPDRVIGEDYMHRWHLIPRNRFFNIYLHRFLHDDDDRALHDHPWHSLSFLLKGKIREILPVRSPYDTTKKKARTIASFWPVFRRAKYAHRIELISDEAWTLFITGPVIRMWGFYCPKGWIPYYQFCDPTDTTQIGKGCG